MKIVRYTKLYARRWDDFVRSSRNSTFLFLRDFMDYHEDRFCDHSLIIEDNNGRPLALFPATEQIEHSLIHSHGGLTYGGLLLSPNTTTLQVIIILRELIVPYYTQLGFKKLFIKPLPYIYHKTPSEEQLYALFLLNAKLVARSASSCIDLQKPLHFSTLRRRKYNRAIKNQLHFVEGGDLKLVWELITEQLQEKHCVLPVHSYEEIAMLCQKFPQNIKLFTTLDSANCLQAATLLFYTETAIHAQYIITSPEGRNTGALDFLFIELLNRIQQGNLNIDTVRYFDFGISTENGGQKLNEGLIFQKEGFGAHTVVYDQYAIDLIP